MARFSPLLLLALLCAALLGAAPANAARVLAQSLSTRQAAAQNVAQAAIYNAVRGSTSVSEANSVIGAASSSVAFSTIPLYYIATGGAGGYYGR